MAKEKKHSFRGVVVASAVSQRESKGARNYLEVPKGLKLFKFPEGVRSFKLDFLPYIVTSEKHPEKKVINGIPVAHPGTPWYRVPFKTHSNVGGNNESVICPKSFGHKCPICEYQLKRIKDGADKEEFKLLYPKPRSLYILIPVGHKDYEEVPYIWDMSDFLFQDTLIEELKVDDSNSDFFMLDSGKTVNARIKWKELGKNNFPEVVDVKFEDRDPFDESILDEIPSLDDMLVVLPYNELSSKFFEVDVEEGGDGGPLTDKEEEDDAKKEAPRTFRRIPKEEEEEESPKPRKVTTSEAPVTSRRKPVKEEEEEEEAEKPASRTVRRERTVTEDAPAGKEKCPYKHVFGTDTDKFDECDTCEIWNECTDEKDKKKKSR